MQRPQLRGLSDGRVDVLGSARGSGRRSHGAGSNGHGGAAAIVKEESLEEEEKKCVAGDSRRNTIEPDFPCFVSAVCC